MAVIVQEMVKPLYSGVCYSSNNPKNPKTTIEYIYGLSDQLMLGEVQGNIVSFDGSFNMTKEFVNYAFSSEDIEGMEQVAKVAKKLEGIFGQRMDIEFAVTFDHKIHVIQARPITASVWPDIQIPEVDKRRIILKTDIVQGSGIFRGPVFVFHLKETERFVALGNTEILTSGRNKLDPLIKFDINNPNGYCLIIDSLKENSVVEYNKLPNMRALVTVNHASKLSHPAKIISEARSFYLGIFDREDLLDSINTGDTLTVASDQTRGLAYDLTKLAVEQAKKSAVFLCLFPGFLILKKRSKIFTKNTEV